MENASVTAFFAELFQYNKHCNQKLAHTLAELGPHAPEKSTRLFSHILNAHQIWNSRINYTPSPCGVWDIRPPEQYAETVVRNYEQTLHILQLHNLDTSIAYHNSKGEAFSNSIRDILFHVINHSTHHRAQIATDFKQNGLDAPVMDYIFHKR